MQCSDPCRIQCAEIMGKEPFDAAMEMFCEDLEMVADFIAPVLGASVDILQK